jgi:hypothetical protein
VLFTVKTGEPEPLLKDFQIASYGFTWLRIGNHRTSAHGALILINPLPTTLANVMVAGNQSGIRVILVTYRAFHV